VKTKSARAHTKATLSCLWHQKLLAIGKPRRLRDWRLLYAHAGHNCAAGVSVAATFPSARGGSGGVGGVGDSVGGGGTSLFPPAATNTTRYCDL